MNDIPETASPPPSGARLTVTLQPALNVALWHNHVPVLTELTLTTSADDAPGDVVIDITCAPPVIRPRSWRLQGVGAGQVRSVPDLDLVLDGVLLGGFTEATRAETVLTARRGTPDGAVLAAFRTELRVLAENEWGGTRGVPDLLAAFVEPNDPEVATLLRLASDQLRARGKPDALEGYQATTKARIWEQVEALWRAVCALDIRYVNPPPSFDNGQRIRPVRQVVRERLATCLDLAVLFAACIEAMGLHPVIVVTKGHAFAGLWLAKHDFGTSVAEDAPGLRTRLALQDLLLFETTLVCGRGRTGFTRACETAKEQVAPEADAAFEAVIDIRRARQRRIRPLRAAAEGYARKPDIEGELAPPEVPAEEPPALRDDPLAESEELEATPTDRLARWRRRLLDISGRNRLLNLHTGGKQALAIDCPDPDRLEDMLSQMRGQTRAAPLRFRHWPELMTGADPRSATLHRSRLQEPADQAFARDALGRRELVAGRDEASLTATLTDIYRSARAAQQEGGANTLFLTIGVLLWCQKGKEARYRAPIILIPVTLERPSVRSGFSLRAHDDETRINTTLLEMLKQDFALRFPTLEAEAPPEDDSGVDVQRILDTFRAKLRDVQGWEITNEIALTNLSFTKFLMWKDLGDRADALRQSEVARLLMDGPADMASSGGGASVTEPPESDAESSVADLVCPLEADSSQLRAVAAAASGKSFVLIGPPGTGKSQTIANIIANTLAQGRSVLFVAEKRAALEVVQRRLRDVKLDDFCLDLFSAKTSKTAVLEQMNRALQARETLDEQAWQAANAEAADLRNELNGYVQELHRRGRNGWTPFRAIGCVLRAETGGAPEIVLAWPSVDTHDSTAYQRLAEQVEEAAATLVQIGDVVSSSALSGIEAAEWTASWQIRLLEAAAIAAARLSALPEATASAAQVLGLPAPDLSHPTIAAFGTLAAVLLEPEAGNGVWALGPQAEATLTAVQAEATRVQRHHDIKADLQCSWRPGAAALPLSELLAAWQGTTARWAIGRMLARRPLRRRLAAEAAGPLPKDCGEELARLVELQQIEAVISAAGERLTDVLGPQWAGLDTNFARIRAGHAWAARLRAAAAACAADPASLQVLREHLRRLVGEGADLLAPTGSVGRTLGRLRDALTEAETALASLASICGSDPVAILAPEKPDWPRALAAYLRGWADRAWMLRDWCNWRGVAQRMDAAGLTPMLHALESGLVAPGDAARAFEANYARWWIGLAVAIAPRLRGFVAAQHETRIERFRTLDARLQGMASKLTRARLAGGIPVAAQRERNSEYILLAHELAKKQRHLPVRQLAMRMPNALRRLTPCLMMSPLSVAQYMPADAPQFDLVIFDEASQIATWDAIGVIGRGRQVIVVGDPKQLPPTRFFERQLGDEPAGSDAVEVEMEDLESILDECLGTGLPATELTWHYRSRHESLIAFSNQTYYGGRLVTFPSPVTRDTAVSFRYVADGVYARAGARTNHAEAHAVVADTLSILRQNLAGGPVRSVGIVSFNAEQQGLIEDLLDAARRDDPTLEPFFAEDAAEPVLVKNLEGVQGEERDVMLFSLTYGPDATGRVSMNFGPLNQAGGERRLNVAVTRSRQSLVVFGSLRPEQIDLARTSAIGVAHLKRFLAFAEQGARAFAAASTGPLGDHESPFEAAVAERLTARGWVVHPQIGVSGFRIDLAILHPDAPGSFLAGVECDGANYHRSASARDRDRLRQNVLEGLGWRILRVWSADWWTSAARETDRVHTALQTALAEARAIRPGREMTVSKESGVASTGLETAATDSFPEESFETDRLAGVVAYLPEPRPSAPPATVGTDALEEPAEPGRFYDDDYGSRLAAMIQSVVAAHGPLLQAQLVQRIARAHGFQRAGREIQTRVLSAIPPACAQSREDVGIFVWPGNVGPATWKGFRRPPAGQSRDPGEMPLEELMEMARECLSDSTDEEAALIAMRNRCGLRRLREASRERCRQAIAATRSDLEPDLELA
jgi:very-short-patch-repair endonuclease